MDLIVNGIIGGGIFIVNHPEILSGFVLPWIVEWLNTDVPNDTEKAIVALLTCIAAALIFKWHSLVYGSPDQFAYTLGIIYLESNNTFNLYFKNSPWRKRLQGIMTSPPLETPKP